MRCAFPIACRKSYRRPAVSRIIICIAQRLIRKDLCLMNVHSIATLSLFAHSCSSCSRGASVVSVRRCGDSGSVRAGRVDQRLF